MDQKKLVSEINDILKNIDLGADAIYNTNRGFIVSVYLLNDPSEELDDNLLMFSKDLKGVREYAVTENPKELTDAISNKNNIIYSRKR